MLGVHPVSSPTYAQAQKTYTPASLFATAHGSPRDKYSIDWMPAAMKAMGK